MAANSSNITADETTVHNLGPTWYWWVHGFIAFITVFGNILVILLILMRPSLRSTQNWFVLSLAVADFLVGAIVFLLRFVFEVLLKTQPTSNYFVNLVDYFLLKASMTNLCSLTLDRYLSIIYPLKHVFLRKRSNVAKIIILAWYTALLFPLIFLLLNLFVTSAVVKLYYVIFLMIFLEILPCIVLSLAYFHILYFAQSQNAQIKKLKIQLQHNYPTNRETELCKKDSRMIRVLGGVIGFFVISYVVDISRAWLKYMHQNETTNDSLLSKVSFLLLYANSAVNVFFYALFKKDFRSEISKFLSELFFTRKSPSWNFSTASVKTTSKLRTLKTS